MISVINKPILNSISQYFNYFVLALMIVSSVFVAKMIGIANLSMVLCLIAILFQSFVTQKPPRYTDLFLVLPFIGIFICYLIGGLISGEEKEYFARLLNLNIIIVLMPVLILLLKPINFEKEKVYYTFFLSIVLIVICIWSLINYINFYKIENLVQLLSFKSGLELNQIVTGLWHHNLCFYLLIAIATQFDYLLSKAKKSYLGRIFSIITIIVFITFIHFLLSRWSMLCLYAFLIFILIKLFFKPNFSKFHVFVIIVVVSVSTFFLLKHPPLFVKNRVNNTIKGVQEIFNGDVNICSSEGSRVFAFKQGLLLLSQKPFTGVSVDYYHAYFVKLYDKMNAPTFCRVEVHNQFLRTASTYGLPVMLIMVVCIYIHCFRKSTSALVIIAAHFFIFGYSIFDTPFNILNFVYFYAVNFPLLLVYFGRRNQEINKSL